MKRVLPVGLVAALLLTGCVVGPQPYGSGAVIVVPALPSIVVLESEPYYQHSGYHYHYQGDRWYYSRSRSGPWEDLPRDRYPKEVKYKAKGGNQGQGDDQGQGKKKGHDKD